MNKDLNPSSLKFLERRNLLKWFGSLSVLGALGVNASPNSGNGRNKNGTNFQLDVPDVLRRQFDSSGKTLRLGIIGYGVRGSGLVRSAGFATAEWKAAMKEAALKNKEDRTYQGFINQPSLNIKFTGVCDLFDVRANQALEAVGGDARRFSNYRDLVNSNNIDAVIIATPDHWHAPITLEAIKAGKNVYVEKCMTRTIAEAVAVYDAAQKSGIVLQLGHQLRHTESYMLAKEIIDRSFLGDISLIQTNSNRNSPNGAWIYDIHEKANADSIDWSQFNLPGRRLPFDLDRFFRWRKYWDYGTGLFGDLMTHDYDAINQILNLGIPGSVVASGGSYYWKDGREVPDVLQVVMEYPERGFTYSYSATQASERHRPNLIMGSDATMEIGANIAVYPDINSRQYKKGIENGSIDIDKPIYEYEKNIEIDGISSATTKYFAKKGMLFTYKNGEKIDPTYLHIAEWLYCIRHGGVPSCGIEPAFQEAVTTHMAVKAFRGGRKVHWDKKNRKII